MKFRYALVCLASFLAALSETTDFFRIELLRLVKQYKQAEYYSENSEMDYLEKQYSELLSQYIEISEIKPIVFKAKLCELSEIF